MLLSLRKPKDVEDLVRWLNDHASPGRMVDSWTAASNGKDIWIANDQSWQLVYSFMIGTVEITGLDTETAVSLRLSIDL